MIKTDVQGSLKKKSLQGKGKILQILAEDPGLREPDKTGTFSNHGRTDGVNPQKKPGKEGSLGGGRRCKGKSCRRYNFSKRAGALVWKAHYIIAKALPLNDPRKRWYPGEEGRGSKK